MIKITEAKELDSAKYGKTVHRLKEEYPFLSLKSIGKSVLGKDIYALMLGSGEEEVVFAAAFHGSEHITTNISLMFCESLCYSLLTDALLKDINMKAAIKGRKIVIIPRVNPDGCDVSILGAAGAGRADRVVRRICEGDYTHYNANIRGVDINHNFPAGWERLKTLEKAAGISSPAKSRYGGAFPESEPETAALTSYCRKHNVRHVIALHTQGEVIYWSYGDKTPARSLKMAQIMASVSGYALDVPAPIATGGGFKDFFIEEFRRPGFTLEMGRGKNPLDISKAGEIYEKAEEMLALAAIM